MPAKHSGKRPRTVKDAVGQGTFKVLQPYTQYTSPAGPITFMQSINNAATAEFGPIDADIIRIMTSVPTTATNTFKARWAAWPGTPDVSGDTTWIPLATNFVPEYFSMKEQGGGSYDAGRPAYIKVRNDSGGTAIIWISVMI